MKTSEDHFEENSIALPFPPHDMKADLEMEIYVRFMRHLRHVPSSRPEIRILAATQFVADMMDIPDAQIAKVLVDLGLRAPRISFPESYLEFADTSLMREVHEVGYPNAALRELRDFWGSIGEDRFAAFKRHYPSFAGNLFQTV